MPEQSKTIYTIGHSTRSQEEFLAALHSFGIEVLADVRRYPGSKKYPHFSVSALQEYLPETGIAYLPMQALGGRRKPNPDSGNTAWRNEAFRGYADYAETDPFKTALGILEGIAAQKKVAYMCSEAVWWRCHRAIISDYLKERHWQVLHIMKENSAKEHPFTPVYLETHS